VSPQVVKASDAYPDDRPRDVAQKESSGTSPVMLQRLPEIPMSQRDAIVG
jgi:hypothetical protein